MRAKLKMLSGAAFVAALVFGPAIPAAAASSTVGVGEAQLRDGNPTSASDTNWYRESTQSGGAVHIYNGSDTGAPSTSGPTGFGSHALELTTNFQSTSRAQLLTTGHIAGEALSDVNSLSYWTFQDSTSQNAVALPSLQLQVDTNGTSTPGGFTTLVFEPYQETPTGPSQPITPEQWQFWDATGKQWWSTRAIHCEGGTPDPFDLAAGAGGPPFTTPAAVAAACPGAVLLQFGTSLGTGPTNVVTATDGLHIGIGANDFTWDFGPK